MKKEDFVNLMENSRKLVERWDYSDISRYIGFYKQLLSGDNVADKPKIKKVVEDFLLNNRPTWVETDVLLLSNKRWEDKFICGANTIVEAVLPGFRILGVKYVGSYYIIKMVIHPKPDSFEDILIRLLFIKHAPEILVDLCKLHNLVLDKDSIMNFVNTGILIKDEKEYGFKISWAIEEDMSLEELSAFEQNLVETWKKIYLESMYGLGL